MRVRVYWNTFKNQFSVLSWEGKSKGRVIDHTFALLLKDCKFVVQPRGNTRVKEEKSKNVHAFVEGTIHREYTRVQTERVRYNPFKMISFEMKGQAIKTADYVFLTTREESAEIYASKEES